MEDSQIKNSAYQFSQLPLLDDLPKKTLPPLSKLSDPERHQFLKENQILKNNNIELYHRICFLEQKIEDQKQMIFEHQQQKEQIQTLNKKLFEQLESHKQKEFIDSPKRFRARLDPSTRDFEELKNRTCPI